MARSGMISWLILLATLASLDAAGQSQSCPININFSNGDLSHWEAYTGNNKNGNDSNAIQLIYDSTSQAPFGTIGATTITEFQLPSVKGITVITNQGVDAFGNFPTIPTINGYVYHYSILLGSTAVSNHLTSDPSNAPPGSTPQASGPDGGYVRGIRYRIRVPSGPSTVPYTMTYAYAMVLENGTHASADQPMARAIVSTPGGVIGCASPEYFLATSGGGLDSAGARANGFSPSPVPTPNESPNQTSAGEHLKDVWTKGWTEVTFDLSAYRGQQVTLTFEADNCVPGGHFAYAYFAMRDECAGLGISGDTLVCSNSRIAYSIPSLDSGSYNWYTPPGWAIDSGGAGNAVNIMIGPHPGWIVATERNSCTTLTDSLFVQLYKGALPQAKIAPVDTTICYGGSAPLRAVISTGTDYVWTGKTIPADGDKGNIPAVPFNTGLLAGPQQSTDYILTIHNDGCPYPISDTFTVNVVPILQINLPADTVVVTNEPLRFQATTNDPYGDAYEWTPPTDLSNPDIGDPIAVFGSDVNTISYLVTAIDSFGCSGKTTVNVTVAHTLPDIFVPNAFTPDAASNRIFRPVCWGISTLRYFRVFNRWGQMLFSTSQMGQGWDGRIGGQLQESATYMWFLEGTDYTGKSIEKRGTVVLIR